MIMKIYQFNSVLNLVQLTKRALTSHVIAVAELIWSRSQVMKLPCE